MSDGIELVRWRDSHYSYEEEGDPWPEDYLIDTVGWVTDEGSWLRLEAEHTPGGPRMILRIPSNCVISRTPLMGYASALDNGSTLPP